MELFHKSATFLSAAIIGAFLTFREPESSFLPILVGTFGVSSLALLLCRRSKLAFGAAVLALGLLVGLQSQSRPESGHSDWRIRERGLPIGLISFEVIEAAEPGPTCRVKLRSSRNAHPVVVDIAEGACDWAKGDRLAISVEDFHQTSFPPLSGSPRRQATLVKRAWRREFGRNGISRAIVRIRVALWEMVRGDQKKAFGVASFFGLRRALSPEWRRRFRNAGIAHLLAVSGLHVGLVAVSVFWLSLRLGFGRLRFAILFSALAVAVYVVLSGAHAPAIRAGWMACAFLLSLSSGPMHRLSVFLAVAASMLLFRPQWLGEVSFQMSVLAVVGILTAPPGSSFWTISFRLTWFLAPPSVFHFGGMPWVGVLANLVAIPLFAFWILPTFFFALGFDLLLGRLGLLTADVSAFLWELYGLGVTPLFDLSRLLGSVPSLNVEEIVVALTIGGFLDGLLSFFTPGAKEKWPNLFCAVLPPWPFACLGVAFLWVGSGKNLFLGESEMIEVVQPSVTNHGWSIVGSPRSHTWWIESGEGVCMGGYGVDPHLVNRTLENLDEKRALALEFGQSFRRSHYQAVLHQNNSRLTVVPRCLGALPEKRQRAQLLQRCREIVEARRSLVVGAVGSPAAFCHRGSNQWVELGFSTPTIQGSGAVGEGRESARDPQTSTAINLSGTDKLSHRSLGFRSEKEGKEE